MNVRANGEYLQGFWKNFGLEHRTKLYTRVQKLEKVGSKWKLQSSTFVKDGPAKGSKIRESGVSSVQNPDEFYWILTEVGI